MNPNEAIAFAGSPVIQTRPLSRPVSGGGGFTIRIG